jgi:2,4'-dihydroxyacetophenone dioxygenase
VKTLHIDAEEIPWVTYERAGIVSSRRLLQVRPEEDLLVTQMSCGPSAVGALHRHHGPVYAFTQAGSWGHDRQFLYRPGVYVYETPGVVHRFLSGPEGATATFIYHGDVDFIGDGGEVVDSYTPANMLARYLEECEAQGLPRPNLLS